MAIYSAVPPPPEYQPPPTNNPAQASSSSVAAAATATVVVGPHHAHNPSAASTIDIEAWTVSALSALSVSPIARGTGGTPLSIPLDDAARRRNRVSGGGGGGPVRIASGVGGGAVTDGEGDDDEVGPPRRPPSRRDSQRRREALLKGKEGSRARRRWENDRLVHVPNVQPPLPTDWEVHPTHPVQDVPYHIAQYWDKGLRQRVEEERAARRVAGVTAGSGRCGFVSRELRNTAKRTPAVAGWVRVLEEPVRRFLLEERDGRRSSSSSSSSDEGREDDEDEDEIVFSGRKQQGASSSAAAAAASREGWKRARREIRDQPVDSGVVFDSLGDEGDESGAFKRFLTHSISDYYGLASRSATVGRPPRRVVYVGIKPATKKGPRPARVDLPRPMWELF